MLVNVSAVCGLVMATLYCLLDTRATILSPEVVSITPTQWATFVGTSETEMANSVGSQL